MARDYERGREGVRGGRESERASDRERERERERVVVVGAGKMGVIRDIVVWAVLLGQPNRVGLAQ